MKKIYGYSNMQKVVGIPPMNSAQYYNNRYGRRQMERDNRRGQTTYSSRGQIKTFAKTIERPQARGNSRTYTSTDANMVYYMEYCKARNTRVYGQLNPDLGMGKGKVIDYRTRSSQYSATTVRKTTEAYNAQAVNATIIDFEKRKKASEKAKKQSKNTKSNTNKNNSKNSKKSKSKNTKKQPSKVQGGKKVMSKQEEMKQFKSSIKQSAKPKTDLDRAADAFEKALREKREYDEALRKNGYRVIKGNRNVGRERD